VHQFSNTGETLWHPLQLPLEQRQGDLFADKTISALAHGCNCAGSMGRGIAVEFRKRWPAMYDAYRAECKAGRFRPGTVFVWDGPDTTIFNLATQPFPGPSARPDFIHDSLKEAARIAESRSISLMGMPRIGAGYGGLEWAEVKRILDAVGTETEVVLAVYEGPP
jgi:O-acetyl-ADP-ribose deacetylase (regulator of RNase III)